MNEYTYKQKQIFRDVPLSICVRIANRCMKGVNFSGCSKSSIILTFEKEMNYGSRKADRGKFLELMLKASDICILNKEKLYDDISEILK